MDLLHQTAVSNVLGRRRFQSLLARGFLSPALRQPGKGRTGTEIFFRPADVRRALRRLECECKRKPPLPYKERPKQNVVANDIFELSEEQLAAELANL